MINDGLGYSEQRVALQRHQAFTMTLTVHMAVRVDKDCFVVDHDHSSTSSKIERAPVAVTIIVPSAAK